MTRAQWVMLIWLDRHPGLSQKELAELLEVEPISVARLVDRLEARGLVERRTDPADRRVWRLHLSPAATAEVGEIACQRAEIVGLALARLDPELIRVMSDGLRQMKAALGNEPRTCARDAAKRIA
ncbi:MAG: MarR family winged helix-turn-helix transcriptional regulator [Stellaceae bacterium]